jgi:hypothetical protein
LISLHARLPADAQLYASFPLSHSERFILEVVDGYRVSEVGAVPESSLAGPEAQAVLLLRRPQLHGLGAVLTGWQIVAASRDYALLRQQRDPSGAIRARRARG